MSSLRVIENKISAIKKYLKILGRYQNYSQKVLEEDLEKRGVAERYLYLAVQATIDLAEAVIAYKKWRKPTTFSEAFDILAEEEIISQALTQKMVKMTGFHNILAHDYEKINYAIVEDILKNKLKDSEEFTEIISKRIIQ